MSFSDLPPELVTIIIKTLVDQEALKSAASTARTCRSLYLLAIPILYRSNIKEDHSSLFAWAISNIRVDTLQRLLENGAPINQLLQVSPEEQLTPLALAARDGQVEIVRQLLTVPGVEWNWTNQDGETPLHLAVASDENPTVELLLSHDEVLVDARDGRGRTPLGLAAQNRNPEIVELLLVRGADPDARSDLGYSPLWLAADSGSLEVVQLLMDTRRVDANIVPESDGARLTPLMAAIHADRADIVEYLVFQDVVSVNFEPNGVTAYEFAVISGRLDMADILRDHPDVHARQ